MMVQELARHLKKPVSDKSSWQYRRRERDSESDSEADSYMRLNF
jgi:hypothetical protein